MAEKYLNMNGLTYYDGKIKAELAKKADKNEIPTKVSELENDSGFITMEQVPDGAVASNTSPKMDGVAAVGAESAFARGDHVHPTDTSRLATDGDGSDVTVTFNPAATKENVATGDTLSEALGKIAKLYTELSDLAFTDTVDYDSLDQDIKDSLALADSALQSYTETDPTVPDWAKEDTKPTYTAAEVGAIPVAEADTFAKKSDLANVYKYKGSVADVDSLPTEELTAGDVYNVEEDGMNYAWTGETWDALGMSFTIDSITNAEIDALFAE